MKIKKGDYISWGHWMGGWVLDVYPKSVLWIHGLAHGLADHSDFILDTKLLTVNDNLKIIVPYEGFEFIHPPTRIRYGHLVWDGSGWMHMPDGYYHPWSGFAVQREK